MQRRGVWGVAALMAGVAIGIAACSDKKDPGPTQPTPQPVQNPPRLTAPVADTPETNTQLDTLRPTLTVKNGTSDQTGTRTYEFQISDNADFSTASSLAARGYKVVVTKPGVAEGANGTTNFTVEEDLQPTTRLYWRARMFAGRRIPCQWIEASWPWIEPGGNALRTRRLTVVPSFQRSKGAGMDPLTVMAVRVRPVKLAGDSPMMRSNSVPLNVALRATPGEARSGKPPKPANTPAAARPCRN